MNAKAEKREGGGGGGSVKCNTAHIHDFNHVSFEYTVQVYSVYSIIYVWYFIYNLLTLCCTVLHFVYCNITL